MRVFAVAGLAVCLSAGPASAQEAKEWVDVGVEPGQYFYRMGGLVPQDNGQAEAELVAISSRAAGELRYQYDCNALSYRSASSRDGKWLTDIPEIVKAMCTGNFGNRATYTQSEINRRIAAVQGGSAAVKRNCRPKFVLAGPTNDISCTAELRRPDGTLVDAQVNADRTTRAITGISEGLIATAPLKLEPGYRTRSESPRASVDVLRMHRQQVLGGGLTQTTTWTRGPIISLRFNDPEIQDAAGKKVWLRGRVRSGGFTGELDPNAFSFSRLQEGEVAKFPSQLDTATLNALVERRTPLILEGREHESGKLVYTATFVLPDMQSVLSDGDQAIKVALGMAKPPAGTAPPTR